MVLDNLQRGHRQAVRWGPLVEADVGDRSALDRVFSQTQNAQRFPSRESAELRRREKEIVFSNNLENVAPDLQRVAAEQERLRYTRRYRFSPWPRGPQRRTVNCFVPTICPLPVH